MRRAVRTVIELTGSTVLFIAVIVGGFMAFGYAIYYGVGGVLQGAEAMGLSAPDISRQTEREIGIGLAVAFCMLLWAAHVMRR